MRPSLSAIVRSALLRESSGEISSDAASRPPDPAEGDEPEIDPDRTDVFHSVYDKDKEDLDKAAPSACQWALVRDEVLLAS